MQGRCARPWRGYVCPDAQMQHLGRKRRDAAPAARLGQGQAIGAGLPVARCERPIHRRNKARRGDQEHRFTA